MASGVNKWIGIGYLGRDPEEKKVGDQALVTISIGCSESWKDKNGEKQERTEWVKVDFWGDKGKPIMKYFKKGKPIYVEGKITTNSWEDKEGNKRYSTSVRASLWSFVPSDKSSDSGDGGSSDDEF